MNILAGRDGEFNSGSEMLSRVSAQVRDAHLRKALYVDGGTHLVEVCRQMQAQGLGHVLVRDAARTPPRLGIFTTTDLRDALLLPVPPQLLPVRDVARFELVEVQADAELFEALWLMVRHRVHRLIVRDGAGPEAPVLGILSQLDLVSFVANHSHIVALQIADAASLPELQTAARRVEGLVAALHGSGIRIDRLTRLVSELNSRLLQRLWALLAPPEVLANTCLLALGSEGRGEQILKTDQDNALLLRDSFEYAGLQDLADRFNAALVQLGWPPCPGQIMISNPLWRQPVAGFKAQLRAWVLGQGADGMDGPMRLAIFCDASVVAGDASLLASARAELDSLVAGNDIFLLHFAAAADQFHEPRGWFSRLSGKRDELPLDLKKLGIFPLVHGVRALSLQCGLGAPSTAERLRGLVAQQRLDANPARDLLEALHLLMGLRLTHQLRQHELGGVASNEVRPSDLSTLEREALRDALAIVARFRDFLRSHFRFE